MSALLLLLWLGALWVWRGLVFLIEISHSVPYYYRMQTVGKGFPRHPRILVTKIWRNGPSGGCLGRDKHNVERHTFKLQFGENLVMHLKRSGRSFDRQGSVSSHWSAITWVRFAGETRSVFVSNIAQYNTNYSTVKLNQFSPLFLFHSTKNPTQFA